MKLTCAQMDVLISFYIEGDLSSALKSKVEEHMKNCASCRAKYDIIKTMLTDLKNNFGLEQNRELNNTDKIYNKHATSQQYKVFKNNLSAYLDNELSNDESIKLKKFTINNIQARKDLEDNYNIRKLMKDSFKKTKEESRLDFSRNVLRQLEVEEEVNLGIHPAIKILITFTVIVLALSSIVLMSLSV